jgi:hypothetical protein
MDAAPTGLGVACAVPTTLDSTLKARPQAERSASQALATRALARGSRAWTRTAAGFRETSGTDRKQGKRAERSAAEFVPEREGRGGICRATNRRGLGGRGARGSVARDRVVWDRGQDRGDPFHLGSVVARSIVANGRTAPTGAGIRNSMPGQRVSGCHIDDIRAGPNSRQAPVFLMLLNSTMQLKHARSEDERAGSATQALSAVQFTSLKHLRLHLSLAQI